MATFVTTITLTDQGMKDVQATCDRAEDFKKSAAEIGVEVKGLYWTLGSIDGLLIFDAPDDEAATTAMLHLGASGNVHTKTARAFEAAEMQRILSQV